MALRMSKKGFKEAHKQLAASAPSPVPAAMTETPPVSSTPSSSKSTLPPQIPGSASSSPLSSRSASYSPSVYREVMQSLKYGVNFNVVSSNPAYAGTWVQVGSSAVQHKCMPITPPPSLSHSLPLFLSVRMYVCACVYISIVLWMSLMYCRLFTHCPMLIQKDSSSVFTLHSPLTLLNSDPPLLPVYLL